MVRFGLWVLLLLGVLVTAEGFCQVSPPSKMSTKANPTNNTVKTPVWENDSQAQQSKSALSEPETFHLQVTQTRFLPPAMYGTWSIRANVMRTNAPMGMYKISGIEVWSLARVEDMVWIENVTSKARSAISVDQVSGNTATFHYSAASKNQRMKITEVPTVTVDGDRLMGINRQTIQYFDKQNRPVQQYFLEIAVEGSRLSGSRINFGPSTLGSKKEFQVEPLRHE